MRRTAALLMFLAIPAMAQETLKPFSLLARSQHYSINIDVVPAGETAEYNVTVIDLATNAVVVKPHLRSTAGVPQATAESDVGDLHFRVQIGHVALLLPVFLQVTRGETVVDEIRLICAVRPFEIKSHGSDGLPQRPLPPDTYRVGGDVKAPRVISRVEPAYTDEARRARVSGIVIVETLIDKTGVVRDVQVLKPMPFGLDQAAIDAVKQWRFEPATKNGEPVNVVFNLTVNFKIATPAAPPPR